MSEFVGSRKTLKHLPPVYNAPNLKTALDSAVTNVAAIIAKHPHVELTARQKAFETIVLAMAALIFAVMLLLVGRIALNTLRHFEIVGKPQITKKLR